MKIIKRSADLCGEEIGIWHMENNSGAWVELSSLGAGITGVGVPDRDGKIENVALGYASPSDYMNDGPCMGKCPGRYANRIARGRLCVDGKEYLLDCNCGPNHLHGGPTGFHNRIWSSREMPDGVEFSYVSASGEENYPGEVRVICRYRWDDDCRLSIEFEATSDARTVINLTNHCYWNLRGADSGCVLDHVLRLKASRWLPTDDSLAPLGRLADVEGSPMDFTTAKTLGRDIRDDFDALRFGKGYDNCWALDGWSPSSLIEDAAVLTDHTSGRRLTVSTDQPGVQVYTGNWLSGSPLNRSGRSYDDYDGVAIEAQGFPDAPNQKSFPSQHLSPGEIYRRRIIYLFTTV